MRGAVLGLVAALAVASAAAAGPREFVHDCAQSAPDDDETTGLADLEQACPGLTAALDALGVAPLLPESTRANLTRDTLERSLALAAPNPAASVAPPARASLDRILPTLGSEHPPDSWWDRLKRWLREHLGGGQADPQSSWFDKWLGRWKVSDTLASIIFYTLSALIIAAAIGIVLNEMRASGAFGPRGGPALPRAPGARHVRETLSLADVAAAPLARRAALLFEVLVHRLGEAGRLGTVRDRTHRELSSQPPFSDATDRARFARLAEAAEAQLFAPAPVPDEALARALNDGEALLGALAAPVRGAA